MTAETLPSPPTAREQVAPDTFALNLPVACQLASLTFHCGPDESHHSVLAPDPHGRGLVSVETESGLGAAGSAAGVPGVNTASHAHWAGGQLSPQPHNLSPLPTVTSADELLSLGA